MLWDDKALRSENEREKKKKTRDEETRKTISEMKTGSRSFNAFRGHSV